jgi:hypothetical protein
MTDANIPMVRAGIIGRLWQDRLPVRRHPEDETKYITAHLIDCRSFAGFSGSPCFVQQAIGYQARTGLLGLMGGHFDDWMGARERTGLSADGKDKWTVSDDLEAPVSTGVGYVIPVEFISETLMLPELVDDRRAEEAS